jgi:hypothetical protein
MIKKVSLSFGKEATSDTMVFDESVYGEMKKIMPCKASIKPTLCGQ